MRPNTQGSSSTDNRRLPLQVDTGDSDVQESALQEPEVGSRSDEEEDGTAGAQVDGGRSPFISTPPVFAPSSASQSLFTPLFLTTPSAHLPGSFRGSDPPSEMTSRGSTLANLDDDSDMLPSSERTRASQARVLASSASTSSTTVAHYRGPQPSGYVSEYGFGTHREPNDADSSTGPGTFIGETTSTSSATTTTTTTSAATILSAHSTSFSASPGMPSGPHGYANNAGPPPRIAQRIDWADTVNILLEGRDAQGNTPLLLAAASGDVHAIDALLREGADHLSSNDAGCTPLMLAAANGHIDVLKRLIDYGCGGSLDNLPNDAFEKWFEAKNRNGETALQMAAKYGSDVCMFKLSGTLEEIEYSRRNGSSWINEVKKINSQEGDRASHLRAAILRPLPAADTSPQTRAPAEEITFIVNGQPDAAEDVSVAEKSESGPTALMISIATHSEPDQRIIALMSSSPKQEISRHDREGNTALHLAAAHRRDRIVAMLLDYGAAPNPRNRQGLTPLMLAAKAGQPGAVANLVTKGAKVNETDSRHESALTYAATHGHLHVARILLDFGANIEHCNEERLNPLVLASNHGHQDLCKMLQAAKRLLDDARDGHADSIDKSGGISVGHVDREGNTALHLAVRNKHLSVVRMLKSRGAPSDQPNAVGKTPLDCAVDGGHRDIVHLLLEKPKSEGLAMDSTDTVLHVAACLGKHELLRTLCTKLPKDIDKKNRLGNTALHCAAYEGNAMATSHLIASMANCTTKNKMRRDPLCIAAAGRHLEVLECLLKAGTPTAYALAESAAVWTKQGGMGTGSESVPDYFVLALIDDLLRFPRQLIFGEQMEKMKIAATPESLVKLLASLPEAGEEGESHSWKSQLRDEGISSLIIVQLDSLVSDPTTLWKSLGDPNYRRAAPDLKRLCCAGLLATLTHFSIDPAWIEALIQAGLSREILKRYGAALAQQQLSLINAGRHIEAQFVRRMETLPQICAEALKEDDLSYSIGIFQRMVSEGWISILAKQVSGVYLPAENQAVPANTLASAVSKRLSSKEFVKIFDTFMKAASDNPTALALAERQLLMLKLLCERLQ